MNSVTGFCYPCEDIEHAAGVASAFPLYHFIVKIGKTVDGSWYCVTINR
jgi:hypothetical protein